MFKIPKLKKDRVATEKPVRRRRIGLIFAPAVRICQAAILGFVVYLVAILVGVYFVPMIGGMVATESGVTNVDNWLGIISLWLIPYLFVSGLLFVGTIWFIRWFARKLNIFSEDLIERYRDRQEELLKQAAAK